MMNRIVALAGIAALAAGAAAAQGQTEEGWVAGERDWSAFKREEAPVECWAVSKPRETVNTRGGEIVSVRRGDILLYARFEPGGNRAGYVTFTGGYPFKDGSTVTLTVGGTNYDFFTQGEWAWPFTEDDAKLVADLKAGSEAVLTGQSSRGTMTRDTFSLSGFTAMYDEAARRCAN